MLMMMTRFFLLAILLQYSVLAFDCNSVADKTSCQALNNCVWSSNACGGAFSPTCSNPPCYYVDPENGSDSNGGSVQNPFKTLSAGFSVLSGNTGSIIVINYIATTEAELLSYVKISSAITIKPLFDWNGYVFNFKNFDESTIPSGQSNLITISSGSLTITSGIFNSDSSTANMGAVFELQAATLSFNNVSIFEYEGSALLVESTSSYSSAVFQYTTGLHYRSSFAFKLMGGTHGLTGVNFLENKAQDWLIYCGCTLNTQQIYIKSGNSTVLNVQDGGVLRLANTVIEEYNGNFIDGNNAVYLAITDSVFQNLALASSIPFIRIAGTSLASTYTHVLTNVLFYNITVKNSLIEVERYQNSMTLTNVTMENIEKSRISAETMLDFEYDATWYGGVCLLAKNAISLIINTSTFKNISSHCFGLVSCSFRATWLTFNNTGVQSLYSQADNGVTDYTGVSWIIFSGGTQEIGSGSAVRVENCQFIENTFSPSKGGALRVIGSFPLALNFDNNQWINNGAYYGGAIYIENILHTCAFTSEQYLNNTAFVDGGAIAINCQDLDEYQDAVPLLKLTDAIFDNNKASARGGAIYAYQEILSVADSLFYQNSAKNGGAIFALKSFNSTLYSQSNNTFQDNVASLSGGAFKVLFDYSVLNESITSPNIFENNQDWKGFAISEGTPEFYKISIFSLVGDTTVDSTANLSIYVNNSNLATLQTSFISTKDSKPVSSFIMSQKSGHDIDYIIMIEIYDNQGNLCDYIIDEEVQISFTSWINSRSSFQPTIEGTYGYSTFQYGRLLVKSGLVLIGEEQTLANLTFIGEQDSSYFLSAVDDLIEQNLLVKFRNCEIGDIYNSITKRCETCPVNSYSFSDPHDGSACQVCPNDAVCFGGSKMVPKAGKWRFDASSPMMITCSYSEACLQATYFDENTQHGLCAPHHEGELCAQCEDGYAKHDYSDQCVSCSTNAIFYVLSIGFWSLPFIFASVSTGTHLRKIRKFEEMRKENEEKQKKKKEEDTKRRPQKQEVIHEQDEEECGEIEELRVAKVESDKKSDEELRVQKIDSDKKSDEELHKPNEEEESRRERISLKAKKLTSNESLDLRSESQEVKSTKQEKEQIKYTSLQAAALKIVYNYVQILTLIWIIPRQIAETDSSSMTFNLWGLLRTSVQKSGSIDCLLASAGISRDHRFFAKYLLVIISPFALYSFGVLCYAVYRRVIFRSVTSNKEEIKSFSWIYLMITAFVYQPSIIQNSMSVLSCQNYNGSGGKDFFMTENPSVRCWQGLHAYWAYYWAIPCLVVFGIFLPALLFYILRKNRNKLEERSFMAKYLFIYASYKTGSYFWEFVILFRKWLIFLLFAVFYGKPLQCTLIFTVILAASAFHVKYPPYKERILNWTEGLALIGLLSMIYFQLLLDFENKPYWIQIMCSAVVGVINLGFFLILIYVLYESNKSHLQKIADGVKRSFSMSRFEDKANTSSSLTLFKSGIFSRFLSSKSAIYQTKEESSAYSSEVSQKVKGVKGMVRRTDTLNTEDGMYRTTTAGNLLRPTETQENFEIANIDPNFIDEGYPLPSSSRHHRTYSISENSRIQSESEEAIRLNINTPRLTSKISLKPPEDITAWNSSVLNNSQSLSSQALNLDLVKMSSLERTQSKEDGSPFSDLAIGKISKKNSSQGRPAASPKPTTREKSGFFSSPFNKSSNEEMMQSMKSDSSLSMAGLARIGTEEETNPNDFVKFESEIANIQYTRENFEHKNTLPPINEIDERFLATEGNENQLTEMGEAPEQREGLGVVMEKNRVIRNYGDRTITEANEEEEDERTFVIQDDKRGGVEEDEQILDEEDVADGSEK